jgi:hypothetical protein
LKQRKQQNPNNQSLTVIRRATITRTWAPPKPESSLDQLPSLTNLMHLPLPPSEKVQQISGWSETGLWPVQAWMIIALCYVFFVAYGCPPCNVQHSSSCALISLAPVSGCSV